MQRPHFENAARIIRSAPRTASSPETLPALPGGLSFVYAYVGAAERILEPLAETPEAQAMRAQLGWMLEAAVDELPESYRSVVVLREVEQLNTSETAECLGLSEEAVKTRLHRSRALLRRDLEGRMGPAIVEAHSFMGVRCDRSVARVLERIGASDSW